MTAHEATPKEAPALLLIGTGDGRYEREALKELAGGYSVLLLDDTAPTWQQPHLTDHLVTDLGDLAELRLAATRLADAGHDIRGVLTWDVTTTAHAAAIAQMLDTAGLDPAAVRTSLHQAATRAAFDAHGVASARWLPVGSLVQLRIAAEHLGYPFVLKPAVAGTAGALRVDAPERLDEAYTLISRAAGRHDHAKEGLVAEEYQEGPEIGVEVVSVPGRHVVAAITHTRRGEVSEVTDHLVAPALRAPATDAAEHVAVEALEALGIAHGVSHVRVRMASTGPRVISVTPCLADDLIPHLVRLATGIDLVRAAADLAMGLQPDLRTSHMRAAAIGFVHPRAAGEVRALTADHALSARPWCERVVLEQIPGARVAPPATDSLASRLAHVVVTAESPAMCRRHLDRALAAIHSDIDAPPAPPWLPETTTQLRALTP